VGALKNGEQVVGNRTKVKVVKNKLAAPFREVEFDILYGFGISRAGDVLDLAAEGGIVEKSGAWYSYKGERIGQGREAAKTWLDEHPDAMTRIESEVLAKNNIVRGAPAATTAKADEKPDAAAKKDRERPKAQA
jgi:recombination protein RecA